MLHQGQLLKEKKKIMKEAIKEVEKIKEATPVPVPESVPLAKAPSVLGGFKAAPVEDPTVAEEKVVEVDKPESRTDVDNRSVVQKAYDRAEEKLTFKDWEENQNQKEMKEYVKDPAKYTQPEDQDEIADEKAE